MADFMQYIKPELTPTVKQRQDVERRITDEIVKALFARDLIVRVHDGEEFCSKRTTDPVVVQKAVQSTDEDLLFVYKVGEGEPIGSIYLVYGNDGYDVVSDWSGRDEASYALISSVVEPITEKWMA